MNPLSRFVVSCGLALLASLAIAAPPQTINYQGVLTDPGGTVIDAPVVMTFRLYNAATGGAALWTETQLSVNVANGKFNAVLGTVPASPLTLPFDVPYWLTVAINADAEMSPRQPLTASAYAFRAATADTVSSAASITGAQINGAITTATIPSAQITGPINAATATTATNATTATTAGALSGTIAGSQVTGVLTTATIPGAQVTGAILQGGNTLGAAMNVGTKDNNSFSILANNVAAFRVLPALTAIPTSTPNLIGGSTTNFITAGVAAAVVSGGGSIGVTDPITSDPCGSTCANRVTDYGGIVGGGVGNQAGDASGTTTDARYATVGGGRNNTASGSNSTIGGGLSNMASNSNSTVGGGNSSTASGNASTVGGGNSSTASGAASTVAGGWSNTASGNYSTVGGGYVNAASADMSTVAGGDSNAASSILSTVGGGVSNRAGGARSTVGGGESNLAGGGNSTVGGGSFNTASGYASMVGGGISNTASGSFSFAAGYRAKTQTAGASPVVHDGAFVWADNNAIDFNSTAANEFSARATGGFRFVTAISGTGIPTAQVSINPSAEMSFGSQTRQMLNLWGTTYGIGVQTGTMYFRTDGSYQWYQHGSHNDDSALAANGTRMMSLTPSGLTVNGTFVSASDRGAKENFASIDTKAVLEKVVALPLESWNYRADDKKVRHLGPMAQDFFKAFAIGPDDKHIATVDEGGVALAAIQGLNLVMNEKDAEIKRQRARIEILEDALAAIQLRLGMR